MNSNTAKMNMNAEFGRVVDKPKQDASKGQTGAGDKAASNADNVSQEVKDLWAQVNADEDKKEGSKWCVTEKPS
jgi:hypothetical protein